MTPPSGAFAPGERVLLVDAKDRRYLIRLQPGGSFQSHAGVVDHDEVIGRWPGERITAWMCEGSGAGRRRFLALRPTLADFVTKMPRGAQVIYPKDLGAIVMAADLYPGARVLEAGVGSGALSATALRLGCSVHGYELRSDFAARARANVAALLGEGATYEVSERDIYEGIDERLLDRILLDLPEPWRVVEHAEQSLTPGGILCCFLPTITQTVELRARLASSSFGLERTVEVLERSWHIEGRSTRPDHRMVAHTGFITTARLLRRDELGDEQAGAAERCGGEGDGSDEAEETPSPT